MKQRALFVLPLLLAGIAQGQTDPLQLAVQLFQQGNYGQALEQFQAARRSHPSDAALVNFIGITETKLGRIEEADRDYESAARLDPRLPGPYKNLGFNYLGEGRYDLAEKPLLTALRLNPADPFVHYYLTILYLSTQRDQLAIPHLKPAETQLANDPATAYAAIVACLKANAGDEALRLVGLLEQQSALSVEQEFHIAELLNGRQMYAASADRFRRISELQPGSWQSQYNLAVALIRAKKIKDALPLLAGITAEQAKNATLMSSVASTYEAAGETALALDTYDKAIAADPRNPDYYLDATRLLMDLDRYEEAITTLERGIAAVPDDYPLTIRLGAIEAMRGNREAAREHYRKAIAKHPALALGYVALAQSYMKAGDDQQALQVLTEGRGPVGSDFALEYVYGLVSIQLGHQPQAMDAFKNAETLAPTVAEPHYQLGLLYMKLQQWQQAQQELEQVLKLEPDNAATYYQLSRAYQRQGNTGKAQQMAAQASVLSRTQHEEAIKTQELRFGVPAQKPE